jgi:hypothetical protein
MSGGQQNGCFGVVDVVNESLRGVTGCGEGGMRIFSYGHESFI